MKDITILSTYVEDVIIREDVVQATRLAGPAYFIEQVFRTAGYPHTLIVGRQMRVEIEIKDGQERGRVCGDSFSQPIPPITTSNLLISTLWREWDVETLLTYSGKVWLDVQGFVRNPAGGFGVKQSWEGIPAIAERLFCLKATAHELDFLPEQVVTEQKAARCLIVTHGGDGSEVFFQGQRYQFSPQRLTELPDTLGAGDTYFANFVIEFLRSGDVERAGQIATQRAAELLERKPRCSR